MSSARPVDADAQAFLDRLLAADGTLLFLAPHMDDCVLGCGGLLARLAPARPAHVVYATDGRGIMASPRMRRRLPDGQDIGAVRQQETRAALASLGVAEDRLTFLGFPENGLRAARAGLSDALVPLLQQHRPRAVFVPFRFDRHADHLALHRVARDAVRRHAPEAVLVEYFVYYRWRLLRARDVRRCLAPAHAARLDLAGVSAAKRAALDCFESQTTCYYPWQHKPVLTDALLREFAAGPEVFVVDGARLSDGDVLTVSPFRMRLLHRLEPPLKVAKEWALSLQHRVRSGQG